MQHLLAKIYCLLFFLTVSCVSFDGSPKVTGNVWPTSSFTESWLLIEKFGKKTKFRVKLSHLPVRTTIEIYSVKGTSPLAKAYYVSGALASTSYSENPVLSLAEIKSLFRAWYQLFKGKPWHEGDRIELKGATALVSGETRFRNCSLPSKYSLAILDRRLTATIETFSASCDAF